MFKALLWKEWRQLASLRWVGLGLGALLPIAALTFASGARQRWMPFVHGGRAYSAEEILVEAIPLLFVLGLWPLVTLLVTTQSFSGDRAAGTESFLIERPVPRGRIWRSRVVAALGSVATVVAGSTVAWWLLVATRTSPPGGLFVQALRNLGLGGSGSIVASFLAGMVAAALVGSPLAALLLGVVLVAIPVYVAISLGAWSSMALVGPWPVGLLAPGVLAIAYPLASFLACCRGEPAGRGRITRALATLGVGLVVTGLLFVVGTLAALRVSARELHGGAAIEASPAGEAVFVASGGWNTMRGGWIVDLERAKLVRFLPPPLWGPRCWSPDGRRLAVPTSSGPLGSGEPSERIEFCDPAGRPAGRTVQLGERQTVSGMAWMGNRLVLLLSEGMFPEQDRFPSSLRIQDPDRGDSRVAPGPDLALVAGFAGPVEDGRLFLVVRNRGKRAGVRGIGYRLLAVDPETAQLGSDSLVEDVGQPTSAAEALSPSGRFWILDRRPRDAQAPAVLDLRTGKEVPVEGLVRETARWLRGDILLWTVRGRDETRLLRATLGETPAVLRRFDGPVEVEVSPDRRRILVSVLEISGGLAAGADEPPRPKPLESLVYEAGTGRWVQLATWPSHGTIGRSERTAWAGPTTLARTGPGFLALESLAAPGRLRAVIGSATD